MDAEANEESGFGVSVDMSRYFSDERARLYVWVQSGRRVRWLAARLRRRLRLPAPPALLAPAGLLHPDDPLALIQPQDTIKAIPAENWFTDDNQSTSEETDNTLNQTVRAHKRKAYDEVDASQNELELVKQKALRLLDQFAGLSESVPEAPAKKLSAELEAPPPPCNASPPPPRPPHLVSPPPPSLPPATRRRRRVRRRPKNHLISPNSSELDESKTQFEVAEGSRDGDRSPVLRNVEPRAAPRLVRALC